ncbi:MAG: His-Xaa-Ser system protein HxsD [Deltaproteobacteria bacterium]|nr:His-Xaa-Ser system protein HxsD [Deltaproteobacteria bacterium]
MSKTYEFEIDTNFYPQDAVYSVSYLLLEKYYIKLKSGKKNSIIMQITTDNLLQKSQVDELMRRIEQELINQTLRLRIAKENQKLREYILGKALLGAQFGVTDNTTGVTETGENYLDDPLGIATPWEEKKACAKKKNKKAVQKKKK